MLVIYTQYEYSDVTGPVDEYAIVFALWEFTV